MNQFILECPSYTIKLTCFVLKVACNENNEEDIGLSYLIDENPPWYMAILLGLQVSCEQSVVKFIETKYQDVTG